MVATARTRTFVPAALDCADVQQIQPLYRKLLDRPLNSVADVERLLADASELCAVVDEYGSRRYIDKSCHTDDPAIEKAFMHFIENVEPSLKPLVFELQRKVIASPHSRHLTGEKYQILLRKWQADVDLFREENIPLEVEQTKRVSAYDKTCGAMTISFRGKDYTLQQAARFLEETDRRTREEVWTLIADRRLGDAEAIEDSFEKLLDLRTSISANAGMPDFRAYMFKTLKRFDYTPDDCLKLGDAVEKLCVPLVRELDRRRAAELRLPALRPWDLNVDVKGRSPLRPFAAEKTDELVDKTGEVFRRLSPELAEQFFSLRAHRNLDLDSRKGKQPGGYQCSLEESRQPFIFMNAAGLQRDVETLLHEGGHAFHFIASSRAEDLIFVRSAPMEFCEVASMSMELLGSDHFDVYYASGEAARAKRTLLEGIVRFFPWMATIDGFQHWLYTHPGHSRAERRDCWLGLLDRFGSQLDWTGLERHREVMWQRQLHLFHVPFYYVEYGIAQLGALQLWLKSRTDPRGALAGYRAALALGGTRPLPRLFAAAGIHFDFSERTVGPLMQALGEELARLPA